MLFGNEAVHIAGHLAKLQRKPSHRSKRLGSRRRKRRFGSASPEFSGDLLQTGASAQPREADEPAKSRSWKDRDRRAFGAGAPICAHPSDVTYKLPGKLEGTDRKAS